MIDLNGLTDENDFFLIGDLSVAIITRNLGLL